MNKNKQKGDYPPRLKLNLLEPTLVKFVFDKPKTGEGKYGKWFLYRFEIDGKQKSWFAPNENVHQQIQNKGLEKDDYAVLLKSVKEREKGDKKGMTFKIYVAMTIKEAKEKLQERMKEDKKVLDKIEQAERGKTRKKGEESEEIRKEISSDPEEIADEDIPF